MATSDAAGDALATGESVALDADGEIDGAAAQPQTTAAAMITGNKGRMIRIPPMTGGFPPEPSACQRTVS